MEKRISKVQRWLDLIAYLVGRHLPVSVEELMDRLPAYARDWVGGDEKARRSVRRKFERDKDELRALGIPIETVPYRVGYGMEEMEGYRILRKDFYLPYLKLLEEEGPGSGAEGADGGGAAGQVAEPGRGAFTHPAGNLVEVPREEAAAAIRGLRALSNLPAFPLAGAARSALRKITFDLDPQAFGDAPVLFAVPQETARARDHLGLLSHALQRRKTLTFTYHGITRGETSDRRVDPWGLIYQHSHWYLVGWDRYKEGERLFRVSRMEGVEVNPKRPGTPDFEMPDAKVLERYRKREAWELGEEEDSTPARVRFRFPTSLWAERNGYGEPVGEEADGSSVREFRVRQPHPFLRWVLSLAGEAEIESPADLKEGYRAMADDVAALYGFFRKEDGDA